VVINNKKLFIFFKKKKTFLLLLFLFLNLIAIILTYNSKNYITKFNFHINKIISAPYENFYKLLDIDNFEEIVYDLASYLNRESFDQSKFIVDNKTLKIKNKNNIWKLSSNKKKLFIAISSNEKINLQKLKYEILVTNFLKETFENEIQFREEINKKIITPDMGNYGYRLSYDDKKYTFFLKHYISQLRPRNLEQIESYTYSKNIFGLFNSIFILLVFFLFFKSRW